MPGCGAVDFERRVVGGVSLCQCGTFRRLGHTGATAFRSVRAPVAASAAAMSIAVELFGEIMPGVV